MAGMAALQVRGTRGSETKIREFLKLIREYAGRNDSVDIVLDAQLTSRAVQNLGDGIVRCVARTYFAVRLSPNNIQAFAEAVHNVIGTIAVNLKRTVRGTRLLQRAVIADYWLSEVGLTKFDGFFRKPARNLLMDSWFSKHSQKQGPIKMGFGLYHYVENNEDREEHLKLLQRKGANNGH